MKLNQVLAIEKGTKTKVYSEISEVHKLNQKPVLFNGIQRVYEPKDDDGEKFPDEGNIVQMSVSDVLDEITKKMSDAWDWTATKEWSNSSGEATGTINIENGPTIENVPVTYLLFLEKQLDDILKFVSTLPILDPSKIWKKDDNTGHWVTDAIETTKTKKVQKALVLFPATPEHPAQTQLVTEDVVAGTWKTVHFSGAIPATQRDEYVEKIEALKRAVKVAREEANDLTVTKQEIASSIFDYIFA